MKHIIGLDAWTSRCGIVVAALLLWLMPAPAVAQLSFGPVVTALPASASVDGTVTINASRLSGSHSYSVRLVNAATHAATTLFTQSSSADSLNRNVVIPLLATGKYTLELRADSAVIDTAAFSIVAKLGVTLTPSTSTPGTSVAFSVGGLSAGSLVLDYAGSPAFGPVSVAAGSYSGKFRVPADRPASLPASVAVRARNVIGRISPRVGDATFAAKAINLSPFTKVLSSAPSTGTARADTAFDVTGKLALNEARPDGVAVSQFWKAADGSVVPLGASSYSVQANGDFKSTQRVPQWGTMSAMQANGSGQLMTVTQFRDDNGVLQFGSDNSASIGSLFDTDSTVDITLLLRDSHGAALADARVDLSTTQADELFGDPNQAPVSIDGTTTAQTPTQYNPDPSRSLGCPAGLQRTYSDAQGRAEFEFAVDPPQNGYLLDGSSVHQATIAPSQDCIPIFGANGQKIGEHCTAVDPAGLAFTLAIRSAHLGYGYRDSQGVERPVTVDVRVDRYTAQIKTTTCKPDQACVVQNFSGSANLVIGEPAVADPGLDVGDPYFKEDVNDPAISRDPNQAVGVDPFDFEPIANLSPFKGSAAAFSTLRQRALRFAYHPGGGRPLREAHLLLQQADGSGYDLVGDFTRESAPVSCDAPDGEEVWKYTFSGAMTNLFRFPVDRWPGATGNYKACGYIYGQDTENHGFARNFCLHWKKIDPALLSLTDVEINDNAPDAVRVTGTQLFADPQVANTNSPPPPSEYNVGAKSNSLGSGATLSVCVPQSRHPWCDPYQLFDESHKQFSKTPSSQPSQSGYGDGATDFPPGGGAADWDELFDITIPLFRWYWGVPELLSAEVFADLGIKAQALLDLHFDPTRPADFYQQVGGAMAVTIWIGVDIDVLFGVLVDAGAMISGSAVSSIVATSDSQHTRIDPCFAFLMDFSGWLEIGCPIAGNIFDPTCYIPDVEESFNIIDARDPAGCELPTSSKANAAVGSNPGYDVGTALKAAAGVRPPPVDPITPEERRALYRHPAIAFDSDGAGLALWLDEQGRLVSAPVLGRAVGSDPAVVSSGWGIRDVAVAFIGPGRAVAVWAENLYAEDAFRHSTIAVKAANQHLRYATWNGHDWSAVADLTAAGYGEGQVRLARCSGGFLECPRNGLITAVWQRNSARDMYHAAMHIMTADFDGSAWTRPVQVDQSGTLNITPTLVYQSGHPVVGWVRHDPGVTLSDTGNRHFAYRHLTGRDDEAVDTAMPPGIAAPSLATVDADTLAVAFTIADPGYGFIGTRQAVFLGSADCNNGRCGFSAWKVHDAAGRSIYGERPQLLIDSDGLAVITLRGLGFGSANNIVFEDDPPGMKSTTGELIQLRSALTDQPVPVLALTRDAATHFQPVSALNPVTGDVVALSVNLASPTTFALQLEPTTLQARQPAAASLAAVGNGVELAATALDPDLAVDALVASSAPLVPGGTLAVKVTVGNHGSTWKTDADRYANVRVWWDNPQTRTTYIAALVDDLAPGARRTVQVSLPVPAAFHNDEKQTLRATIVASDAVEELDASNNEAARTVGGMPVPQNAQVVQPPHTRMTNLVWDASGDARVKGYRIYVEDEPGVIRPLGSSFNAGFVDLAAQYGVARRYYVSTYSARGAESERAGPLVATPVPADDALFANGFE